VPDEFQARGLDKAKGQDWDPRGDGGGARGRGGGVCVELDREGSG